MPKYTVELTLHRTVEADDIDHAEEMADSQKDMVVRTALADNLGWELAVLRVAPLPNHRRTS